MSGSEDPTRPHKKGLDFCGLHCKLDCVNWEFSMPETSSAILEAKRRARDYWDIDGLPALLAGATTVLLGIVWLYTGNRSVWDFLLFWAFFSPLLKSKKTIEWLKGRITYPRTGYVAPPKATPYSKRDPYTIISITKEPVAPIDGRASRK